MILWLHIVSPFIYRNARKFSKLFHTGHVEHILEKKDYCKQNEIVKQDCAFKRMQENILNLMYIYKLFVRVRFWNETTEHEC